uniref:Rho-GAP domain-containing protein n=1 Tax=Mesocestoides corti TaxID=53468 RepID=A0A5K3EFG1_MESCO
MPLAKFGLTSFIRYSKSFLHTQCSSLVFSTLWQYAALKNVASCSPCPNSFHLGDLDIIRKS